MTVKRIFSLKRLSVLLAVLIVTLLCSGCEDLQEQQEEKIKEQISQAEELLEQQEYQDAQEILEQLLEEYPEDSRAYGLLSDLFLTQNDWKSARDILEQGIKSAETPGSLKEKQGSLSKKIAEQESAAAVLQPAVTYWGSTYFWKYSSASVEAQGAAPEYPFRSDAENQLIRRGGDGKEQVLYTGPGSGDVVIFQDRLYFSAGEQGMGCVPPEGGEVSFTPGASPVGCDLSSEVLLLATQQGETPLLETMGKDGNRAIIAEGTLLSFTDGLVYFQSPGEESGRRASLCSIKPDGSDETLLAQVMLYSGEGGVRQVQAIEDTVYFSHGRYRAEDGVFEEGSLFRVQADGSGFSRLFSISSPVFSIYLDGETPILRYQANGGECRLTEIPMGSPSSVCLNLDSRTSSNSPMPCGPIGVPFTDGKGNLWLYPDRSGTPTQLLSSSEGYLSTGNLPADISQDGASWNTVSQPCISGGYLYFTAIESTYDHAGDTSGGAAGFRRVSSRAMRKSLSTGETEVLFTY